MNLADEVARTLKRTRNAGTNRKQKVKINKKNHCAKEKVQESNGTGVVIGHSELKFMKEIAKLIEFSEMKCSF